MKQGLSLQELAVQIQEEAGQKRDFLAPSTKLVFDSTEGGTRIHLEGSEDFRVTDHFHKQVASRLGIHKNYYDRMREEAPDLLDENVNHWFQAEPQIRMVRTMADDARAYMSDRFRPLDNIDLASVVLPLLEPLDCRVETCNLSPEYFHLKTVSEKLEHQVKVGDVVQMGLVVSNSEIGLRSVQVEPLIFRLSCSNGAIMRDYAFRKYHVWASLASEFDDEKGEGPGVRQFYRNETRQAADKAFWLKVTDLISGIMDMDFFQDYADQIDQTAQRKIEESPIKVVENIATRFELTGDEHGDVLKFLVDGGELTQWGLANAVTRAAQETDSYDRATQLERIGGEVVEIEPAVWSYIAEKN